MATTVYTNARLRKIPFFTLLDLLQIMALVWDSPDLASPFLKKPSRPKMWWRWDGGLLSVLELPAREDVVS